APIATMPADSATEPSQRLVLRPNTSRPCSQEANAQVTAPPLIASPAVNGDMPRSSTSMSGTITSAARNAPQASPRRPTTAGSPLAALSVPAGSSLGSATASTTSPIASSGNRPSLPY